MDNPFVRGPVKWVTINPGAQTIGSFHPITEGDWNIGACILGLLYEVLITSL